MPMFKSTLILAAMLLHKLDQDCVGFMSHQKLFVCYHLPTRGRAGVKLGDVDTLQTYL